MTESSESRAWSRRELFRLSAAASVAAAAGLTGCASAQTGDPSTPVESPEQALFRRVMEAFTPRRVMWGSNFPSSRAGGYIGQVQLGQTALSWLSDDDRRWILGGTALKLWPAGTS